MTTPLNLAVPACVVDASVAVKLYIPEPGSELAEALLRPPGGGGSRDRFAPDLLHLECGNILWKHVRRGQITADEARDSVTDLLSLGLHIWPASALAQRALELALRFDVTVYDASYLVLSDLLAIPLVTADDALVRKAGGPSTRLVLLDSLA